MEQRIKYDNVFDIERTQEQRAEDLETHWMAKKKLFGRRIWSEKRAKAQMAASSLRALKRQNRKFGEKGPKVWTIQERIEVKVRPHPAQLKVDPTPDDRGMVKLMAKLAVIVAVSVLVAKYASDKEIEQGQECLHKKTGIFN